MIGQFLFLYDTTDIILFVMLMAALLVNAALGYMFVKLRKHLLLSHAADDSLDSEDSQKRSVEVRSKLINDIKQSSYSTLSYLDEMQELTNFDGTVPSLSTIEVNIIELIMSYRREILHETRRGVTVSIRTDMSPHYKATLDTTIFRQLIMHLLRICTYRTEKGLITISYALEKEGLRFRIEDSGASLPEEVLSLFFKGELSDDQLNNLGGKTARTSLNISKSVIDSMQGTIDALTGETGQGLVFSFWIPCRVRKN